MRNDSIVNIINMPELNQTISKAKEMYIDESNIDEKEIEDFYQKESGISKKNIKKTIEKVEKESILSGTRALTQEIHKILIKNGFNQKISTTLSNEIIWSEDFFILFLINYSNANLFYEDYLYDYTKNSFAEKLYKRAFYLGDDRKETWNSDSQSAIEILNRKEIVNTIICMGKEIYEYFNICKKIAYVLNNLLSNRMHKDCIWYTLKGFICNINLNKFNDKNYLFYKFFSIIEKNSNICLDTNIINKLINDKLLIDSLIKAIEIYEKDFKIVISK
jgi:hypothetical protein